MLEKIILPFPPSVNSLFATNFASKRRFKSKKYEQWETLASGLFRYCYPDVRGERPFRGDLKVTYAFSRPKDKRKRDIFNLEKALSDFLVSHGVIEDDSQIVEGTVKWRDTYLEIAQVGIAVEIIIERAK